MNTPAKKSLGQHFLTSQAALSKIADAAALEEGEAVIEIGPGKGVLTRTLLERGVRVVAVEKDEHLAAELESVFEESVRNGTLTITTNDIRNTDPETLLGSNVSEYKLIGNIPYYITGLLLRTFLSGSHKPSRIVFLVQKEVAERVVKAEKESLLSLSVKVYGTPSVKGVVKRGSFTPPPKVDSAILSIENIRNPFEDKKEEERFFSLIHAGFGQKRKRLMGNLASFYEIAHLEHAFRKCGLHRDTRAESVTLPDWICLTRTLK